MPLDGNHIHSIDANGAGSERSLGRGYGIVSAERADRPRIFAVSLWSHSCRVRGPRAQNNGFRSRAAASTPLSFFSVTDRRRSRLPLRRSKRKNLERGRLLRIHFRRQSHTTHALQKISRCRLRYMRNVHQKPASQQQRKSSIPS